LTLVTTDGHRYSASCLSARGGPDRPFNDEDLWAKIDELSSSTAPGLTRTMQALHSDCNGESDCVALAKPWRAVVDQFFNFA